MKITALNPGSRSRIRTIADSKDRSPDLGTSGAQIPQAVDLVTLTLDGVGGGENEGVKYTVYFRADDSPAVIDDLIRRLSWLREHQQNLARKPL